MSHARLRSVVPRSRSHLEVKGKNVVFALCRFFNTHFCAPCQIVGASVSCGQILVVFVSLFFVVFFLHIFRVNKA